MNTGKIYDHPKLYELNDFDGESWADIVGFEGIYMVSNLGRVKSLVRTVGSGKSINHRYNYEKIMTMGKTINRDAYIKFYDDKKPNICIVDGVHRYECAEYAVKVFKPEILIVDNHQQDYVFMCPSLDVLLEGVKMERFIQPDHSDHSGNPWATAIFYLNEKA